MSHSVMVTRTTTTTTSTTAILLNTGYLKTFPGILKLLQVVIGCIVVGLIGNYFSYYNQANAHLFVPELFLLLISTTCLIATGCLLISCLLSISTATIIAKTFFELVYHSIGFALYLASSVYLLVEVNRYNSRSSLFEGLIAAGVSILLIPESLLYLASCITYLHAIITRNAGYTVAEYGYSNKLFAGSLGAANTVLYFVSTYLAFRHYRLG